MIFFIFNFIWVFSLIGMDGLPSEIIDIIVSYSYDKELLKTASSITDLYKSIEPFNRLARCNKKYSECIRKSLTIKELFKSRLAEIDKERNIFLNKWETSAVEWVRTSELWGKERCAVRCLKPIPVYVARFLRNNQKDINQRIAEVLHIYWFHGSSRITSFTNILPLQICCISSEIKDIKFLLNLNADPNKKDFEGRNALMLLCSYKDIGISQGLEKMYSIAQILIQHGTDVDLQDSSGKTALMYAFRAFQVPCEYWDERGGYCQIGVPHTAYNIPLIYLLLGSSNNLNLQDNEGNTALFHALRNYHDIVIIDELIARGASVNIKNKDNETPLSLARKYYNYDSKVISRIDSLTSARIKRLSYGRNNPLIHSLVGFLQLGSSIFSIRKTSCFTRSN